MQKEEQYDSEWIQRQPFGTAVKMSLERPIAHTPILVLNLSSTSHFQLADNAATHVGDLD